MQKTIEAIGSVIDLVVTIIDDKFERIAGTNDYLGCIGEKINSKSAFGKAIKNKEIVVIGDKDKDVICKSICKRENCVERASICYPIIIENKTIGAVGVIAANDKQRKILNENRDNLINFLGNLSRLITARIFQHERSHQIELLIDELEIILNSIDNGVIFVDTVGNIIKYNDSADHIFNLKEVAQEELNIENFLTSINTKEIIEKGESIKNKEFIYKKDKKVIRGIYNAKIVKTEIKILGLIITARYSDEIIEEYNKLTEDSKDFDFIIGKSKVIRGIKQRAIIASKSNSNVIILGESGTGKDLFARAIHYNSSRGKEAFVPINCAAIPETLLESELFGYDEGAFTGAKKNGKMGKFELAQGGTIFLDEIGDMNLTLQAKLLRVIQDRKIEKIGGRSSKSIDVRIIAATNKNLEELVSQGKFREDLYYRLHVLPIYVEPLRNRIEDIDDISIFLLKKVSIKLNKNVSKLSPQVLECFRKYNWPGNVRELENAIEYAVNMTIGETITLEDLPDNLKLLEKNFNNESNFILKNSIKI